MINTEQTKRSFKKQINLIFSSFYKGLMEIEESNDEIDRAHLRPDGLREEGIHGILADPRSRVCRIRLFIYLGINNT